MGHSNGIGSPKTVACIYAHGKWQVGLQIKEKIWFLICGSGKIVCGGKKWNDKLLPSSVIQIYLVKGKSKKAVKL